MHAEPEPQSLLKNACVPDRLVYIQRIPERPRTSDFNELGLQPSPMVSFEAKGTFGTLTNHTIRREGLREKLITEGHDQAWPAVA